MNSLTELHAMATGSAHAHPNAAMHHMQASHGETAAPHSDVAHSTHSGDKPPSSDNSRDSCAACAACHVANAILNSELDLIDIPKSGTATFPVVEVSRLRQVASGLERPPRA